MTSRPSVRDGHVALAEVAGRGDDDDALACGVADRLADLGALVIDNAAVGVTGSESSIDALMTCAPRSTA